MKPEKDYEKMKYTVTVIDKNGFEDKLITTDKIKADNKLFRALFFNEMEVHYKKEVMKDD